MHSRKGTLYLLSLGATLSLAGTQVSQLAISARLFELDASGGLSSHLVVLNLLGVTLFGLLAGGLLSRFTPRRVGIGASAFAALLSFYLFFRVSPASWECLSVVFAQAFLFGLEHPNLMRFLHSRLGTEERGRFFSFTQSVQQVGFLVAPVLGAFLIREVGYRWCFAVDGASYLLSSAAWAAWSRQSADSDRSTARPAGGFFEGYRLTLRHPEIRGLSLFRFFNHLAYTTFNVSLPLWVARAVTESPQQLPTDLQGQALALMAFSMVASSFLGGAVLKRRPRWVAFYPWASSLLGVTAVWIAAQGALPWNLWMGSLALGVGQYFFRLTGIVIGAAVTPAPAMASVIVAGDTLTRGVSFCWGSLVATIAPLWLFSLGALVAPFFARSAVIVIRSGRDLE